MEGPGIMLPYGGEQHRRVAAALSSRYYMSKRALQKEVWQKVRRADELFVSFTPETEADAARRARRDSGRPEYTTIIVPYSYALLLSLHTYWASVFMARDPIMQYQARHGETQGNTESVMSIIDYQLRTGHGLVPLFLWLMDVGKYGEGIIHYEWNSEEIPVVRFSDQPVMFGETIPTGKTKRVREQIMVRGYEGIRLQNIHPLHFFPDTRHPLIDFQKGEFCGHYMELGWHEILRRQARGEFFNVEELRKMGGGIGRTAVLSPQLSEPNVDAVGGPLQVPKDEAGIDYVLNPGFQKIIRMEVELVPRDWFLEGGGTPEKWVFHITEDMRVVIGAQPLGRFHGRYSYEQLSYEPDAYSLRTRGALEVLEPLQNTMDWLFNSLAYETRRNLNSSIVFDPSRLTTKDVLDPLPGGGIRMRPDAYGTDPRTTFTQLQYAATTQNHPQLMQLVGELMQRCVGANDNVMGISPRGRQTATETRATTGFSASRLKNNAEFFSYLGWEGLAQAMLQESQQFFTQERIFRIAGNVAMLGAERQALITPDDIAGFYDFVPVDGTMPVDRLALATLMKEIMMQGFQMPMVMAKYDWAGIFAWTAQLAGFKNIHQFELAPDEALMQAAQAGNVVPTAAGGPANGNGTRPQGGATGGAGGGASRNSEGLPVPAQLPGVGSVQ